MSTTSKFNVPSMVMETQHVGPEGVKIKRSTIDVNFTSEQGWKFNIVVAPVSFCRTYLYCRCGSYQVLRAQTGGWTTSAFRRVPPPDQEPSLKHIAIKFTKRKHEFHTQNISEVRCTILGIIPQKEDFEFSENVYLFSPCFIFSDFFCRFTTISQVLSENTYEQFTLNRETSAHFCGSFENKKN